MKIRELHLRNFGKFEEKRIVLKDGINLFYGQNESGKTTAHTFIKCMLFGLERGRGRASVNDTFSIYEPWKNPNYYSGSMRFESGGKRFCLERHFDKYSRSARLCCEDDGEEFSLEHGDLEMLLGGLTAANYENTVAIGQMRVETNQSLATELQNYATNYYAAGHSEMDLEGAVASLHQKRKNVEREIREHLKEKQEKRHEVEQEAGYVWRDIHRLEQEIQEVERCLEKGEEAQVKQDLSKKKKKDFFLRPTGLFSVFFLLFFVFFALEDPWNYLVMIVLALAEGIYLWNRLKDGRSRAEDAVNRDVMQVMAKKVWEKERLQNEWKEKQVEYGNLQEQLQELEETGEEYKKLDMKKAALEFAVQRLLELAKEVQQDFGTNLNQRASEILGEITGGKYTMLCIDEKLNMSLYTGERKISIEQVSRGTIEQIYFALRMAASEILHEEEFPVICDDTFVHYDDERLENTLAWLVRNRGQVLIFTCQKREGEILKKLGVCANPQLIS